MTSLMESISWTNKWALMGIAMMAMVVIQELPNYTNAVLPSIPIAPFSQNYYVGWSTRNSAIFNRGYNINLTLNNFTGCGFRSFDRYLRGYVSSTIRLVPRYSAGVIVAFYMSSHRTQTTTNWDEIDFEFLGNVTGQPWILQTNVYVNGKADREHRIYLWFDPTTTFHTYSIVWTPQQIIWYVDTIPIRIYRRTSISRLIYPTSKPMVIYGSIWNGDEWATRGGLDKINYTYAPFTTTFSRFRIDACKFNQSSIRPACFTNTSSYWWSNYTLSEREKRSYTFYTNKYTIYNYCNDYGRFPIQPAECKIPPW